MVVRGGALLLLMGQAGRSRPVERTLAKVKARQQPFACTPWHLGVSVRAFALLNLLKPQTATFHIFIQSPIIHSTEKCLGAGLFSGLLRSK